MGDCITLRGERGNIFVYQLLFPLSMIHPHIVFMPLNLEVAQMWKLRGMCDTKLTRHQAVRAHTELVTAVVLEIRDT